MAKKKKKTAADEPVRQAQDKAESVVFRRRSAVLCPNCGSPWTRVYCTREWVHYMQCVKCDHRFKAIERELEVEIKEKQKRDRLLQLKTDAHTAQVILDQKKEVADRATDELQRAIKDLEKAKAELIAEVAKIKTEVTTKVAENAGVEQTK